MNLCAIASLTTAALTPQLSQTRTFYAMAHDGLLPSCFAKIHSHTETPWISTLICGNCSFLSIGEIRFGFIFQVYSILFSLAFCQ